MLFLVCRYACICGLLLCAPLPLVAEQSQVASTAQRQALRQQISNLTRNMEKTRGSRSVLENDLASAEKAIGKLTRKLYTLDRQLKQQGQELKQLLGQRKTLVQGLATEQQALQQQVRAAYMMGRQERLQLLLNQQQPETLSRVLAYHDYLARARAARIQHIAQQIEQLAQVEQNIAQQDALLKQTKTQRLDEKETLEIAQQQRQQTITSLSQSLNQSGVALKKLKQDEARLSQLLNGLQQALADVNIPDSQQRSFRQRKGQLAWPTKGRIRASFGSQKIADLRWDGVVISAPEGRVVKAVYSGRVAYADWLRGFGLLMILDHGDGYMTLYGYNQSLYKEVGDWVEPGEDIALVGRSGGQSAAGIYFGIRYKGKAKNPKSWCKKTKGRQVG